MVKTLIAVTVPTHGYPSVDPLVVNVGAMVHVVESSINIHSNNSAAFDKANSFIA